MKAVLSFAAVSFQSKGMEWATMAMCIASRARPPDGEKVRSDVAGLAQITIQ